MQPSESFAEQCKYEDAEKSMTSMDVTKSSKPAIEKRRRARINNSLNELKRILLKAFKKDASHHHSKLEKADILEMTVKYLKKLESQQDAATRLDPAWTSRYKAGFAECRNEVVKFLSTNDGVTADVRTRLLRHLAECQLSMQEEEEASPEYFTVNNTELPNYSGPLTTELEPATSEETLPTVTERSVAEDGDQIGSPSSWKLPGRPTKSRVLPHLLLEGQFQLLPQSQAILQPSDAMTKSLKDVAIVIPVNYPVVPSSQKVPKTAVTQEVIDVTKAQHHKTPSTVYLSEEHVNNSTSTTDNTSCCLRKKLSWTATSSTMTPSIAFRDEEKVTFGESSTPLTQLNEAEHSERANHENCESMDTDEPRVIPNVGQDTPWRPW